MIDAKMILGADLENYFNANDTNSPYAIVHEMSRYHPPAMDPHRLTLIAAYCLLFVSGMTGNAWVTFVVGRVFRQSRTEAPKSVQIFILALCLCELTMLALLIFLIGDLIFGRWIVPSRFLCRLYLSSEGMNKFCSPFLLASLSGFCYVRLRGTPTSARSTASTRKALYLVVSCVCVSLILMTPIYEYGDLYYLFEFNETHILNVFPKCAFHPPDHVMIAFTAYGFVAGYAIPAALFTFFYAAALYSARNQRKRSGCHQYPANNQQACANNHQRGQYSREGSQRSRQTTTSAMTSTGDPLITSASPYLRRVRTTAFGLVFVYLACWTPYWSMSLYQCLTPHEEHGYESEEAIVFSYFVHMLPYINCAVYPLVYTLLNSHLKKDYERATAAKKRRRLAGNKPHHRLPLLDFKFRNNYSCNNSAISTPVSTGGYCSVDAVFTKGWRGGNINSRSGVRRSSSVQLPMSLGDRFLFSKTALCRTLTPVVQRNDTMKSAL